MNILLINNLLTNFVTDFLCTAFLFAISLFLAVGATTFYRALKKSKVVKAEKPAPTKRKRRYSTRKKQPQQPSSARTIEIDPDRIDRIFVKKSS